MAEFPLFVFTLLGGAGAGVYLFVSFLPVRRRGKAWMLPALVLVLLIVSGFALLMHLGRPDLVFNAFRNPTSGLTLEGIGAVALGVLVVIDLAISVARKKGSGIVGKLAAIVGILLLCAMGYAYASFSGVPVWGTWQSYALFVPGGLALGATLAALFVEDGYRSAPMSVSGVLFLALGIIGNLLVGAVFAGAGYSVVPFAVGAVFLAVAVIAVLYGRRKEASWIAPCVLLLAFIGIAVARYAFYLAV